MDDYEYEARVAAINVAVEISPTGTKVETIIKKAQVIYGFLTGNQVEVYKIVKKSDKKKK